MANEVVHIHDLDREWRPPFDEAPELAAWPTSKREHLLIEHTAHFVRTEGGQAEFRLKLKQDKRLSFLEETHNLHPYYTYLKTSGSCLEVSKPALLPEGWSFWRSNGDNSASISKTSSTNVSDPTSPVSISASNNAADGKADSVVGTTASSAATNGNSAVSTGVSGSLSGLLGSYGDDDDSDEEEAGPEEKGDVPGKEESEEMEDRRERSRSPRAVHKKEP
eukprot:gnl/MRDRNA2_/MRDRNA2_73571_c0_seq1.p1 gnl/MRDRNA2_/MRDRNA2_73571_c0~~gnl/MRDRNA2_/MRDRNA2_73571_c0_seq1.p1  ORF type:complete len:221 (+),score=48.16 gnl/MRDRNA2_/MRDRNA2_73571_c0_seq1:119-781(+)